MAKLELCLIGLLFIFISHNAGTVDSAVSGVSRSSPSPSPSSPTSFIVSSCRLTRYPALCIQSLSGYATAIRQSKRQLAQTALSVSLSKARAAAAFVSKLGKAGRGTRSLEYQAVRDCIENMGDTVDRLSQSVKELGNLRGTVGMDFMWHMSNVQTWVSAALTDECTCLDGFADHRLGGGQLKATIRKRITFVAQVTSNALALVNRFAAKHKNHVAGGGAEP